MSQIAENLKEVRQEIAGLAEKSGRSSDAVQLLAVSKTFPAETIQEAIEAGQISFGENRVQEAERKISQLRDQEVRWHLIGHLQSNKAKLAAELFDVIESLDSEKLARKLDRHCEMLGKTMPVLIQINIGEESQKYGIEPGSVSGMVDCVDSLNHLELRGLMAIPPFDSNPEASRPYFRRLAELFRDVNQDRDKLMTELSMGMSNDYAVAIEEGATWIRLGTAIFGAR